MVGTEQQRLFSMKLSSSSSRMKALIHSLIVSHVCRLIRALSKAKAILIEQLAYPEKSKYRSKVLFGSFRLHYNWGSSSHVAPAPAPDLHTYLYYDSHWNSINGGGDQEASQLSGYLQWLEEKGQSEEEENEIDKLADMFIANCHEKFRLEKVESYRRFQEMLARSM